MSATRTARPRGKISHSVQRTIQARPDPAASNLTNVETFLKVFISTDRAYIDNQMKNLRRRFHAQTSVTDGGFLGVKSDGKQLFGAVHEEAEDSHAKEENAL